jgi:hypothetical protein
MLNRILLLRLLRVPVWEFTLKVSHAPISVECLFSMTLLLGDISVRDLSGFDDTEVEAEAEVSAGPASPDMAEFTNGRAVQLDPRLTSG